MKKKIFILSIILSSLYLNAQTSVDTTKKAEYIHKFTKELVGKWMHSGSDAYMQEGYTIDSVTQNKLPYTHKTKSNIEFYGNGNFIVEKIGVMKPYQIIGFKYYGFNYYTIKVKLDGFDYEALINDNVLQLTSGPIEFRWTVYFEKKK